MNLFRTTILTGLVATSLVLLLTGQSLIQRSYAHHTDGATPIPDECKPFVGNAVLNKDHDLAVLNGGSIMPGDDVTVEASFDGHSAVDHVRFLWYDGTDTLVRNENVAKETVGSTWSVHDTFSGVYGPNTEWTVIACFISEDHTISVAGLHVTPTSFFVLPEAGIGAIAVVGSSLIVLTGFSTLKKRRSIQS